MAEFIGDVNELFDKAFGIYTQVPVYFVGDSRPEKRPPPVKEVRGSAGGYLFDRFAFQISEAGLSFKDPNPNETTAELWYLPEATVVSFDRFKHIVKTIVTGKDGTVKELIGLSDWEITFKGFIINYKKKTALNNLKPVKQEHNYPREYRKQMNEVFGVNQNMTIYSRLANDLNIRKVVIERLSFPAMEGYDNVQPYELTCSSDEDIILDLNA